MSILTEAKVRKLFKEAVVSDNGVIELNYNEKLTPAARSFLSDHHVQILQKGQKKSNDLTDRHATQERRKEITVLDESPIKDYLVRLMRLYPLIIKAQRVLHAEFQDAKVNQLSDLLKTVENIVGQRIESDISDYNGNYLTNSELQAIRVTKCLDQSAVLLDYTATNGQLSCYDIYVEITLQRRQIEQELVDNKDKFYQPVIDLLKSIEVIVFLLVQE